jgi:beta-ureidopropionase / N-carbamoyl-L-amino-acid hydrolase
MLFVPNIGGVSHDFIEEAAEEDIVLDCEAAARATMATQREFSEKQP